MAASNLTIQVKLDDLPEIKAVVASSIALYDAQRSTNMFDMGSISHLQEVQEAWRDAVAALKTAQDERSIWQAMSGSNG